MTSLFGFEGRDAYHGSPPIILPEFPYHPGENHPDLLSPKDLTALSEVGVIGREKVAQHWPVRFWKTLT